MVRSTPNETERRSFGNFIDLINLTTTTHIRKLLTYCWYNRWSFRSTRPLTIIRPLFSLLFSIYFPSILLPRYHQYLTCMYCSISARFHGVRSSVTQPPAEAKRSAYSVQGGSTRMTSKEQPWKKHKKGQLYDLADGRTTSQRDKRLSCKTGHTD